MGIEPTQSAWKAEILAIELHPQATSVCNRRLLQLYQHCNNLSTLFLKKILFFQFLHRICDLHRKFYEYCIKTCLV